ncbi:ATG16 family protein [Wolbachia endosymbiont (group A) of Epirrhoe alternata]|uniref:ATG16 family protein n=1 Tax=Wolbachia endosymbiont (group A) of Epirrhoe alternata TaxID=2954007 RepID=UPI00222F8D7F|nr:ATG16 family protein [Wolbachia endosymbiont (group A) of Epirrhoe alternata]
MHNSNQNLSPGATSPTDITSDQEGTINKNSIESGTEQSLQGSLVGNQESLNDYVDASSTPVSEGINDTMQVADDNEVTSGNKGNRSVVSSDSTTLSEGSVNGQEGVTKSKKGKGKRSTSKRIQRSKQQLKEKEITALKAQQNTQEVADLQQQLADKEKEIAQLKQQQPNAEVDKLKADLTAKEKEVDKLKKENKELEAENKKIQQLKQGNGARYTATVGMGLAAGLIAFTALERTVKLEMLVMIGIAVASALVAGGITYAVLPSTQVDGAKAQEVNENGKKK